MGTFVDADGGNRRPDLQRRCLLGDHADDLEENERPRQELASRLQSAAAAGISDKDGLGEGRAAVQGKYFLHPDAEGLSVHGGGEGPRCACAGKGQADGDSTQRR